MYAPTDTPIATVQRQCTYLGMSYDINAQRKVLLYADEHYSYTRMCYKVVTLFRFNHTFVAYDVVTSSELATIRSYQAMKQATLDNLNDVSEQQFKEQEFKSRMRGELNV